MAIDYKHAGNMLPMGVLLFLISSFSKVYCGYFIGEKYRLSKKAGLRLGFSLIPRGEFSIILAGTIAMNHTMPYSLKSLTGIYVLLSAVVGSILVNKSDWIIKRIVEKEGQGVQ
jgi:CPA2 family monovalent cation:H+ antiporter-2